MSERDDGPPQSDEPEVKEEGEEQEEPELPLAPTGLGPPHAGEPIAPTGLGPPHAGEPIAPTGLGPPHASEPIEPTGLGPPHAGEPIAPTGLGPPHMNEPIAPTGLGPPHAGEPIEPTGLGPPHAGKPIAPTGLGPPHMSEPIAPTGLGPPHMSAGGAGSEPVTPTGLGPPHLSADDASPEDADDESGKPPPGPPMPPGPVEPTGLGPPHSSEPGASEPPASPDQAVAQQPPLPPWLRAEPVGTPPPGAPGRVEAVHPGPPALPLGAPAAIAESPVGPPLGTPAATAESPPAPAPAAPPFTPSRLYGSALLPGVLLTLAGGSAAAGGILALWQTDQFEFSIKALICGGIATLLLAGAVLLRLVRGSDEIRGLLAVVGISFAAASLTFADNPASPSQHDTLLKFALVAGLVAVLGWFASMVVPSAVAGFLAAVALPAAVGAGVWLSLSEPTIVEAYVAALGVGLALAALLPRIGLLRPHPTGLSWTLAGAAIAVAVPAVALTTRGDATALAAGASASAALLLLAQGNRHLLSALGALAGFAALESVVVTRFVAESDSGDVQLTRLVVVAIAGAALIVIVAAGVLLTSRGWSLPSWSLPLGLSDLMLAASLALAVVSLFSGPGDVPVNPIRLNPAQMLPGSSSATVAVTLLAL